jgi:hypothetical protein
MLSYNIYSNRSGILGIHERHESIHGVICVIMRFNLCEEEIAYIALISESLLQFFI